jgi:hypothetical protein
VPPFDWYEEVPAVTPLMQGDIVDDCPLLRFRDRPWEPAGAGDLVDALTQAAGVERVRAVVMTQACDLAQKKVRDAVLCPVEPLDGYRLTLEHAARAKGQKVTADSWRKQFDELRQGKVWSASLLERCGPPGGTERMLRVVVHFSRVHSLPVAFLESWLVNAGASRVRLLPPYREHLSQAFARFFMRVGLPQDIVGQ